MVLQNRAAIEAMIKTTHNAGANGSIGRLRLDGVEGSTVDEVDLVGVIIIWWGEVVGILKEGFHSVVRIGCSHSVRIVGICE